VKSDIESYTGHLLAHYSFRLNRATIVGALREDVHEFLRAEATGWEVPRFQSSPWLLVESLATQTTLTSSGFMFSVESMKATAFALIALRMDVSLKRRSTSTRLRGAIRQKAVIVNSNQVWFHCKLVIFWRTLQSCYTVRIFFSSFSIVSDYRLDDQGWVSGRGKGFFL
jgi:hypothetical protein